METGLEEIDTASDDTGGVEGDAEGSEVDAELAVDDEDEVDVEEAVSSDDGAEAEEDDGAEAEAVIEEEVVEEDLPRPSRGGRAAPGRAPPRQSKATTATPAERAKRRRAEPWARRSIPTGSASA